MDFESALSQIKASIKDNSQDVIDDIIDIYRRKTYRTLDEDEVLQGLYQYVLKQMGIDTSEYDNVSKTVEEIIDEYMVYGGGNTFKINFISSFDNNVDNQTLNHALLNFMCHCY
jgi:hypothetical protein